MGWYWPGPRLRGSACVRSRVIRSAALLLCGLALVLGEATAELDVRMAIEDWFNVHDILEADGHVWLAVDGGVCRLRGDEAKRFLWHEIEAYSLAEADGDMWVACESGVFRIRGEETERVTDEDVRVLDIQGIGGDVWVGAWDGAFRVRGDEVQRIADMPYCDTILAMGDDVWMGGTRGLFRVRGDRAEAVPQVKLGVNVMREIHGELWVGTGFTAYRIRETED